jgi:hypothetical protein
MPQERETEEVEALHRRHTAVMVDAAAAVERSGI